MSGRLPDRRLRLAIARLQRLDPADFDAVLGILNAEQRSRVVSLLAGMQKFEVMSAVEPTTASPDGMLVLPDDLAPWLAARIDEGEDGDGGSGQPFSMTRHARAALRRCAASLLPQPTPAPPPVSLASLVMAKLGLRAA